ncbi:MAG TPA: enoyl-CoA hydratase/isomerase family protein [Candidatus Binatia bacterium]|jgi:enoyl-CoA hydratase|nr:enoyl-CoA hydratase/isomerase family protein [Candidatus Binatia bacterium]
MELQDLLYEKRGRTAWVTLNRPQALNAITPEMIRSLKLAAEDARDDSTIRALVITGAGRGFCAGADIRVMNRGTLTDFREFLLVLTEVWSFIRAFPKPTIAAINGVVVGGGFELILVCDFRLAAKSARIGSAEVRINQPMTNGSTYLLSRLIGEAKAKELGMTGDILDAEEAGRIGLVNAVVESEALVSKVEELVQKLVSRGPIAVAAVKQCFARNRDVDIETAIMVENEAATACFVAADQKEGLRAFLEKREPQWSGK